MIRIRYFASLRERMGRDEDTVDASQVATVGDIWRHIVATTPLPPNTLVAVNQEYATMSQTVQDGDEVAFFPPITGG